MNEDREMKEKELKEKEKERRRMITSEYECTRNCRACPFPGAKCVSDVSYYGKIR